MHKAALQALMQPLAISERGLRALAAALQTPAASGHDIVSTLAATAPHDGVAVIDIDGPLSKDESIWQLIFGGTSYAAIRRQLDEAVRDDAVNAIVLNVNSPGGELYGCSELAGAIFAARGAKPITAYVAGQGDSAAYWLASAADNIVINATAEAGSIGVRCMMVDDSKFEEKIGFKTYDIVSSQSPFKIADAADASDRARVQRQMTEFASVFIADVARHRGVSADSVLKDFGQGDVFVGQSAVDAGLADSVGTLDSVIAEFSAQPQENGMTVQKNAAAAAPATPTAGVSNGKCSSCRADMGDGDPMYCKKCMDDDGDEDDAKKAAAFKSAVLGLLGETDDTKAIGAIAGLKAQAEKVAALSAELAVERKAKADAEMATILDKAVADGRVKKAARSNFEKLYAEHGKAAFDAALAVLTPASEPAQPASEKTLEAAQPKADPAKPDSHGLSADQLELIKKTGSTPEKFIAHRDRLRTFAQNGTFNEEK